MSTYLLWCKRHPVPLLIIFGLISLASAWQLPKVRFDPTLEKLLVKEDPRKKFYHKVENIFGSDNITTLYVRDPNLFTPEKLKVLEQIYFEVEDIPEVERVDSVFNTPHFHNTQGTLSSTPLFDGVPDSTEEIQALVNEGLSNPLFKNYLISEERDSLVIIAHAAKQTDLQFTISLASHMENVVHKYQNEFEDIFQIGIPTINKTFSEGMQRENKRMLPVVIIIVVILLFLSVGSLNASLIPLITGGLSLLWTAGFMGAADIPIQLLSSMIPVLIFVIGSTEDTHIVTEYIEMLNIKPDKNFAIGMLGKKVGTAVLLTTLTTVIGFSSIGLNKIEMLKEFGLVSSVGLIFNFIITITVIPVYLRYFGEEKPPQKLKILQKIDHWFHYFGQDLASWVLKNARVILLISSLIFIVSVYEAFFIKIDIDYLKTIRSDHPIRKQADLMSEKYSGISSFFVVLEAPAEESQAFKKSFYLQKVFQIQQLITHDPNFDSAQSLADNVALINREWTSGKEEDFIVPESDSLVAQYLLLLARDDIQKYVTADFQMANIVGRFSVTSSEQSLKVIENLKLKIAKILEGSGITFKLTSKKILNDQASLTLVEAQVSSILLILVVIFFVMWLLFKNIKIAFLSLLPNSIPFVGVFGIMGILDYPLDVGTCVIATISIGVAVDDTIHFFARFNSHMRKVHLQYESIALTIRDELRPIFATSISIALGLSIVASSDFVPVQEFGILTAFAMVLALFADIFVTPILLGMTNINGIINAFDMMGFRLNRDLIQSPFFKGLKINKIKQIILMSQVIELEPDEIINPELYKQNVIILLEGQVTIEKTSTRKSDEGADIPLYELQPGGYVGTFQSKKTISRFLVSNLDNLHVVSNSHGLAMLVNNDSMKKTEQTWPDLTERLYQLSLKA